MGHLRGEIKSHLKGVIQKQDNIFECCKSTFFNFGNKITLKDGLLPTILKHMNGEKQSPFALIVQPIIQRTFQRKINEL